jgi:hypothetical protein
MISAPFFAASRMKSMACEKFFAGSGPQRICTSAILVIPSEVEAATQPTSSARPGFPSRCATFKAAPRDVSVRAGRAFLLDMTKCG